MTELTQVQRAALHGGDNRIRDTDTGSTYILVKEEVYRRFCTALDDTVCTTAEMLDKVMAEDDAHDPTLAFYQQKYGNRP